MAGDAYLVGPSGLASPFGYYPPGAIYTNQQSTFTPLPDMQPLNTAAYNNCIALGFTQWPSPPGGLLATDTANATAGGAQEGVPATETTL